MQVYLDWSQQEWLPRFSLQCTLQPAKLTLILEMSEDVRYSKTLTFGVKFGNWALIVGNWRRKDKWWKSDSQLPIRWNMPHTSSVGMFQLSVGQCQWKPLLCWHREYLMVKTQVWNSLCPSVPNPEHPEMNSLLCGIIGFLPLCSHLLVFLIGQSMCQQEQCQDSLDEGTAGGDTDVTSPVTASCPERSPEAGKA